MCVYIYIYILHIYYNYNVPLGDFHIQAIVRSWALIAVGPVDFNQWSTNSGRIVQFKVASFGLNAQFLDVEVYKNAAEQFHSRIFYKQTDVHAFLSPSSSHPPEIIKRIPKGVFLRLRRICSETLEFEKAANKFFVFFARRGYKDCDVMHAYRTVLALSRQAALKRREKKELPEGVVPLVFPYHSEAFHIKHAV